MAIDPAGPSAEGSGWTMPSDGLATSFAAKIRLLLLGLRRTNFFLGISALSLWSRGPLEEYAMSGMNVPALRLLAMASIVTSVAAVSVAQETKADLPAAAIGWEDSRPRVASVPCVPLPSAIVLAGGPRAHRRGMLPAAAVYVGPRALYVGTLAPWGSLPPAFYAASYPLPYHGVTVVSPSPLSVGPPIVPDAPRMPSSPQSNDGEREKGPSFTPTIRDETPPPPTPETIPAPQPMDIPKGTEIPPPLPTP